MNPDETLAPAPRAVRGPMTFRTESVEGREGPNHTRWEIADSARVVLASGYAPGETAALVAMREARAAFRSVAYENWPLALLWLAPPVRLDYDQWPVVPARKGGPGLMTYTWELRTQDGVRLANGKSIDSHTSATESGRAAALELGYRAASEVRCDAPGGSAFIYHPAHVGRLGDLEWFAAGADWRVFAQGGADTFEAAYKNADRACWDRVVETNHG